MPTLTIALPDDQFERLQESARRTGLSPDAYVSALLEDWLSQHKSDFVEAAATVLEKNREIYRRLS